MPGRGPAPKDPATRARRNADPVPHTTLPLIRASAPELSPLFEWHPMTHEWWRVWQESPLSDNFTDTDWNYLQETAALHTGFWNGDYKLAAELRQRVAKFGATPEDRARLRIFFADADAKEEKRPATSSAPTASTRGSAYGNLRAVNDD